MPTDDRQDGKQFNSTSYHKHDRSYNRPKSLGFDENCWSWLSRKFFIIIFIFLSLRLGLEKVLVLCKKCGLLDWYLCSSSSGDVGLVGESVNREWVWQHCCSEVQPIISLLRLSLPLQSQQQMHVHILQAPSLSFWCSQLTSTSASPCQ